MVEEKPIGGGHHCCGEAMREDWRDDGGRDRTVTSAVEGCRGAGAALIGSDAVVPPASWAPVGWASMSPGREPVAAGAWLRPMRDWSRSAAAAAGTAWPADRAAALAERVARTGELLS